MKINFNKKKILFYMQIGVVSFVLSGCNKDSQNKASYDNNLNSNQDILVVNQLETVEVNWDNPNNYKIVERNGEPYFVQIMKSTITDKIDVIYYVPDGYQLTTRNGQKYGVKKLENGQESIIFASFKLPSYAIGYTISYINGVPYGVRKREINIEKLIKATYELPEGYSLQYINGKFVGVKSLEVEENADMTEAAKILTKENSH